MATTFFALSLIPASRSWCNGACSAQGGGSTPAWPVSSACQTAAATLWRCLQAPACSSPSTAVGRPLGACAWACSAGPSPPRARRSCGRMVALCPHSTLSPCGCCPSSSAPGAAAGAHRPRSAASRRSASARRLWPRRSASVRSRRPWPTRTRAWTAGWRTASTRASRLAWPPHLPRRRCPCWRSSRRPRPGRPPSGGTALYSWHSRAHRRARARSRWTGCGPRACG
mmetsp:Transcript_79171/g.250105  ORF Transcript_79171/g.250105 Transcript_79171/m.250105 type:complete len:227 (-) Transcript_79171:430-1110(-)